MIAWLLGTKLGHIAIGFVACLIAATGMYGYGHHRGVASMRGEVAMAQNAAKTAQNVNVTNQATIATLKAANASWVAQAASSEASGVKAVQSLTEQQKALQMRYDALQAKLARTVNEDGNAHAWACTRVPASVLDALGLHPASSSTNRDCESERASDPTSAQRIDAAGAGAATAQQ